MLKILLVGDYSGVHSNLALALKELGHDVTVISGGDGYKNYPRDIDVPELKNKTVPEKIFVMLSDFLGVKGILRYLLHYRELIASLKGFDVVQLMNPIALPAFGSLVNTHIINSLKKNNSKLYLCALGDDYFWVRDNLKRKYPYSALSSLKITNFHKYLYSLRYVYGLFFKFNHFRTLELVEGVIPGLRDYEIVYSDNAKLKPLIKIPLPSSIIEIAKTKLFEVESNHNRNSTCKGIFHGWQKGKDLRKGNIILDEAAKVASNNIKGGLAYKVITNLPYNEYLKALDDSDIFFDQVYSMDRGVNALIGMANGKVVFSGFESEKTSSSNITFMGVNAVPSVSDVAKNIEFLIKNPNVVDEIKVAALKYIIDEHSPEVVAKAYVSQWCERH